MLAQEPNHVETNFNLGRLYVKQRQYDRAIEFLRRAARLSPDYTQVHYQLYLAYTRTKQPQLAEKALAEFKSLEELDKRTREIGQRLAQIRQPQAGGRAGKASEGQPAMGNSPKMPPP